MRDEPTRENPRYRVEDFWKGKWWWPGNGTTESEDVLRDYLTKWRGYGDLVEGVDYRIVKFWTETEVVEGD